MSQDVNKGAGPRQNEQPAEEHAEDDEEASSLDMKELTLGDSNENSSMQEEPQSVESLLSNFRRQWQRELESPARTSKQDAKTGDTSRHSPSTGSAESREEEAKNLFLLGVEFERNGELYEAIKFYKRAVQLVPDIERKIYENTKLKSADAQESAENKSVEKKVVDKKSDIQEDAECEDYRITIERKALTSGLSCLPEIEDKSTHISSLPTELLMYILRWVVSSDLDMISLERFASVCCGFYISARDSEIWRLACIRTWGIHCGTYKSNGYKSWRQMFIERPRLRFNGCYISKTSYVRPGENSFQDQFYRPWHLVKYFRYLRFFPDGIVLMMTTPDEPALSLDRLKQRNSKLQGVLSGHYRLSGDKVLISVGNKMNNSNKQNQSNTTRFRTRRRETVTESVENTYHLELQLKSHYSRMFCSLIWQSYLIYAVNKNTGALNTTAFEIVKSKFPSFKFSQVNRFHAKTDSPLQ